MIRYSLIAIGMLFLSACSKPTTFFDRVVSAKLKYKIDFVDIELDDFLNELTSERNEIDFFQILSLFPSDDNASNLHDGPGCRQCLWDGSQTFKELFAKALRTHDQTVVDFPFTATVFVVFKDGSCFSFSLVSRDKFDANVLTIAMNRKFIRGINNTSPRRRIDVSGVKGKEEILDFVWKILYSKKHEKD